MNLIKIFKVVETMWPFIKEIVLDKDTPKSDRVKKGLAFSLTISVIFFWSGGWATVSPYVTPFMPPNQTSANSQSDRSAKWMRFLEDQMTEHVKKISELERQLATTASLLDDERRRADELQEQIAELIEKYRDSDRGKEPNNRILNRLKDLRNPP